MTPATLMSHSLPPTRQPLSHRYKLCWLRWLPAWCLLPALFHLIPFAFAMLKARIWATLKLYRSGAVSRLGAPWFYDQRHSASRKGIKDAGGLSHSGHWSAALYRQIKMKNRRCVFVSEIMVQPREWQQHLHRVPVLVKGLQTNFLLQRKIT